MSRLSAIFDYHDSEGRKKSVNISIEYSSSRELPGEPLMQKVKVEILQKRDFEKRDLYFLMKFLLPISACEYSDAGKSDGFSKSPRQVRGSRLRSLREN